ncbi:hypothetical protein L208DRAFT_93962 [Tricholoma matsutake]|nr:hypothetical protein L208DRAFT_93962 [Tricholoma matsutake 945]
MLLKVYAKPLYEIIKASAIKKLGFSYVRIFSEEAYRYEFGCQLRFGCDKLPGASTFFRKWSPQPAGYILAREL